MSQTNAPVRTARWPVVVGALLVQAVLGTVYAFSVFVRPLELEFDWSRATTQWAFSLALLTFALVMIPAGRLQDRVGPRKVAAIGGILLGASFLLGALLIRGGRPWALYLTYGLLGGAGIGFAYVCPIAALVKWFPEKKGLITGVAVVGFGLGALFFAGPASTLLLPPGAGEALRMGLSEVLLVALGIRVGEGFSTGWQAFFVIHGVVPAGLIIFGASMLRNPPVAAPAPPAANGSAPAVASTSRATDPPSQSPQQDYAWNEMLNTPLSTLLWVTFIFGATSGLMAIGQWKPMMDSVLGGQTFAPDWMGGFGRFIEPVGVLAIFNALGRIFWGRVSDAIDRPRAMALMFIAQRLAFMMLVGAQTHFAIFLASAWVGLNFGGNFALFPAATANYFGSKNLGVNYGLMFSAYGVAGIMGPVVGGVLFDATGQYLMAFVFAGVLCFIAAGAAVAAWGLGRQHQRGINV